MEGRAHEPYDSAQLHRVLGLWNIKEGREERLEVVDIENQLLQSTQAPEQLPGSFRDTCKPEGGEAVILIQNTESLGGAQIRICSGGLESL